MMEAQYRSKNLKATVNIKPNSENASPLAITGETKPAVPVFTCLVYVRKNDCESQGKTVIGRVANLDGIEASGSSERFVLGQVTREFKSRVSKMLEEGQEIPWLVPPQPPLADEQVRSVPVHL